MKTKVLAYLTFSICFLAINPELSRALQVNTNKQDHGRTAQTKETNTRKKIPPFKINFNISANTKDILLGGELGYRFIQLYDLSINFLFYARPYKKSVFRKINDNAYFQLKQEVYIFGLTLDKPFYIKKKWGMYLSAGYVLISLPTAGYGRFDQSNFSPILGAGIQYGRYFAVKLGYQYIKIPEVPDNQLVASFQAGF